MGIARELGRLETWTVLGNHDGPTCFTSRRFPRSYRRLETALAAHHLGGRRVELPALGLTLVGGRPLTMGGADLRFEVPDFEEWTLEDWGEHVGAQILAAEQDTVVVLAHGGPTGLGAGRDDIYGCDFREEAGDWGDPDLRLALDIAQAGGRRPAAVVAGHLHHSLRGGGERQRCVREEGTLHLNAAVMPRLRGDLRALTVLRIEDGHATARLEWHGPGGLAETEDLEPFERP
jgi:uncharacterized protein (TIGR04168 family)